MQPAPEPRTDRSADQQRNRPHRRYARRALSGLAAVFGMYFGGFLWEEVSPIAYSVVFLILASSPLLLKMSFWKKLVLLFPLLIVRVLGKVLIKIFGFQALEKLFKRYGLLEARYNRLLAGLNDTRTNGMSAWKRLSSTSKAHLILAFLPFITLIALAALIVKLLRFRLLQLLVEKVMQKGVQDKVQQGVLSASEKLKQKQTKRKATQSDTDQSDTTKTDESKPR